MVLNASSPDKDSGDQLLLRLVGLQPERIFWIKSCVYLDIKIMENINRKVCCTCGRRRKDHTPPFGQQCKLTPLSDEEKKLVLSEVMAEEAAGKAGSSREDSNKDKTEELDNQLQVLYAAREEMEREREETANQLKIQEAALSVKKKQDEVAEVQAYLDSLRSGLVSEKARLAAINAELSTPARAPLSPQVGTPPAVSQPALVPSGIPVSQTPPVTIPTVSQPFTQHTTATPSSLANVPSTILAENPGAPAATTWSTLGTQPVPLVVPPAQVPGVNYVNGVPVQAPPTPTLSVSGTMPVSTHRDGPFVIPARPPPVPANRSVYQPMIDPANQVYARASTAQYGTPVAAAAPHQPGATALKLIQENPGLAAAIGGVPAGISQVTAAATSGKKQVTDYTHGKSLAENFIFKPHVTEKDRPSFYAFMHGAMRLMKYRVQHDNKSILEYLIYYERLCNLACQYRWHAVYDLHQYWANEVEDERATWDDEIPSTDIHRYCHGSASVHVQPPPSGEERKARRDSFKSKSRNDRRDRSSSDSSQIRDGICRRYNKEATGCRFGASCDFDHRCNECDKKGLNESHPALWCPSRVDSGKGGGSTGAGR